MAENQVIETADKTMKNLDKMEFSSNSDVCAIAIYITLPLLLCYWVLEVHYFLRFLLCAFIAKFCKRHVRILDETAYSGKYINFPV